MNLLDKILSSKFTVLGHDSKNEKNILSIIKFIQNKTTFGFGNNFSEEDITSYIDSQIFTRENKISQLIDETVYLIIDLSCFIANKGENRSEQIRNFTQVISGKIYREYDKSSIRVIFLTQINTSMSPQFTNDQFDSLSKISPISLIYIADIAAIFRNDDINIIKDRNHALTTTTNIKSEIRDIVLSKILNQDKNSLYLPYESHK